MNSKSIGHINATQNETLRVIYTDKHRLSEPIGINATIKQAKIFQTKKDNLLVVTPN